MATAKPTKRKFNIDRLTFKHMPLRMRKHKGISVSLYLDKELIYWLWFKPQTGYKSYGWADRKPPYVDAKCYYCGKKKMMADFLAHFKEHYGSR